MGRSTSCAGLPFLDDPAHLLLFDDLAPSAETRAAWRGIADVLVVLGDPVKALDESLADIPRVVQVQEAERAASAGGDRHQRARLQLQPRRGGALHGGDAVARPGTGGQLLGAARRRRSRRRGRRGRASPPRRGSWNGRRADGGLGWWADRRADSGSVAGAQQLTLTAPADAIVDQLVLVSAIPASGCSTRSGQRPSPVSWQRENPTRYRVTVDGDTPAVLALGQAFHPQWQATAAGGGGAIEHLPLGLWGWENGFVVEPGRARDRDQLRRAGYEGRRAARVVRHRWSSRGGAGRADHRSTGHGRPRGPAGDVGAEAGDSHTVADVPRTAGAGGAGGGRPGLPVRRGPWRAAAALATGAGGLRAARQDGAGAPGRSSGVGPARGGKRAAGRAGAGAGKRRAGGCPAGRAPAERRGHDEPGRQPLGRDRRDGLDDGRRQHHCALHGAGEVRLRVAPGDVPGQHLAGRVRPPADRGDPRRGSVGVPSLGLRWRRGAHRREGLRRHHDRRCVGEPRGHVAAGPVAVHLGDVHAGRRRPDRDSLRAEHRPAAPAPVVRSSWTACSSSSGPTPRATPTAVWATVTAGPAIRTPARARGRRARWPSPPAC